VGLLNTPLSKYQNIPFTRVNIDDTFWALRRSLNREHTIPAIYKQCQDTGRMDALRLNWKPGMEPVPHVFWDSDVAKWIEAASYSLATNPDSELEALVDETIDLVVEAQQPDGYLNSYFTAVEPEKRWSDLRDAHELYCAGHLMEAAVAHFEATGKRKLLDAICRYADHIDEIFGPLPHQKHGYCGHPEVEMALVKLYRATGNKKYLELSHYFVEERGQSPNYFDVETNARGGSPSYFDGYFQEPGRTYSHDYNQSHLPVRQQEHVVGHSVRAMYLYSAMVDLSDDFADKSLLQTCEQLWNHMRDKQMYITAGIGPSDRNEGFSSDFDLPNKTAYCETCASVGLIFWNHRLLHAKQDGRYSDMIEQALYNGVISGVSYDGRKFFYDNPLASDGGHHRKEWFDVSCCPANLSRLLSTLGQYIYSTSETDAVIHQYIQSSTSLQMKGHQVKLRQETNYPWDGKVIIHVDSEIESKFGLKLRLPGWCHKAELFINGQPSPVHSEKGYVHLERVWQAGDRIEWQFEMPIERVYAHPEVKDDRGRVALRRGPVVYCFEETDNGKDLDGLYLPSITELTAVYEEGLFGGTVVVRGEGKRFAVEGMKELYQLVPGITESVALQAVPYFAWDNREPGEMLVWIRE
jgi:DUF1680 family protein